MLAQCNCTLAVVIAAMKRATCIINSLSLSLLHAKKRGKHKIVSQFIIPWWTPLCSAQESKCPWCHIMPDSVAPRMVQEADRASRVSNSPVSVRPLSGGPAGRKQQSGSSTAAKEEKVSMHYLHADPVEARSCVCIRAETLQREEGLCARIVQYPFRIPGSLFVLYRF